MITQEQAKMIYNCYAEINQTKDFLIKIKERVAQTGKDETVAYLRDRDNERGYYTLGFSLGSNSSRIASVSPDLALKITEAHLSNLEETLSKLNAQVTA